ncbi:protein kinase C beta type-like [Symsagittifera roscoffensis]|uniref:protein kinase C beta type-like n=1 Tax=Symsagittifera roscoffensis TaxID=84072 RepID=UPI00307C739A
MTKDPERRLGSGESGEQDIESHAFFRRICWDRLARREIQPPYIPNRNSDADTSHFDRSFTRQQVEWTPSDKLFLINLSGDEFDGFSFVNTKMPLVETDKVNDSNNKNEISNFDFSEISKNGSKSSNLSTTL